MAMIASQSKVAPEEAVCMATGNTAKLYGLNRGRIAEGLEADLGLHGHPHGVAWRDVLEALTEGDTPGVSISWWTARWWLPRAATRRLRSSKPSWFRSNL
jgi:enamidase